MEEAKKRLCHNRAGFFEVAVSEMGAWALKKCIINGQFSTKVILNWGHHFYVWRQDRHFFWLSGQRIVLPACSAIEVLSFLSYFKTPAPRSAVKRSTN